MMIFESPFTVYRLPFSMRYLFTVYSGPWLMANSKCMVNSKWLMGHSFTGGKA